ncbi:MAG: hypothetical protein M0P91_05350 [Sulfuricurvum sp.]|jgi:hypothetical protein|uniref:hypothetical protein n=1 Tax=Sulfuricurvum sp. TaxID=2025608 RepID=UPI0025F5202C|nr:hypothetical protein [Sulfuricurvum sp.]MCK9372602.1 hypothetical protein [Sulfuricurvum sp.]
MRRNRAFRVGDVMMILDVDKSFLMPIFRVLELAGYLELENGSETFGDRHYKLLKNTGIRSPSVLKKPCDIVRDENTGEEFILDGNHPVQIADKLKLLRAMKHDLMYRERIASIANIHLYSSKTIRYLEEFTELGIMERITRSNSNDRRMFIVHHDKREALIKELEIKELYE